ncbi:MAG: tetratricopeptide repeat protein [Oscillatoriaceae bacterium SKYG93]|nr:tetratricopeptide repeat protein [Oscillatoriaceae bacterium SKYG93]MDW8452202.1 tetratricopeptide repeat protein [Oscillatoriaceae cyanobacterium SKYGB_i_bin93]HIK26538.1 tetratricopeptide repeat protein [Oscillatoriaceae cyanobacterium M7585_C2015_266]
MKLTLCMLVKNEEATLPACLGSVKDVVDEIVVLDTGSSERTSDIAKDFGARVYTCEWSNDFAVARNQSLKYATGDWILVLDADEVLVPEVIPQIKEAIQNDRFILINLIRHEVGAAQSPYSLVSRLFRNHPDIYFSHPYHASVDDSIIKILEQEKDRWLVVTLSAVAIKHYGYESKVIASRDKFKIAQQAMEAYLKTHPNDIYTRNKLAALYIEIGQVEQGVELLESTLQAIPNCNYLEYIEPPILYEIHYHLGIAYTRIKKLSKAKNHYRHAIQVQVLPQLKIGAYNNLGSLLLQTGDLTGAKAVYEAVLQIAPNLAIAHYNLGIVHKQKGRFKEAIAAYEKAIQLNPNYAEAYQNLGVVLLKVGSVVESLDAFRKAIAIYEQQQSNVGYQLRQSLTEMGLRV